MTEDDFCPASNRKCSRKVCEIGCIELRQWRPGTPPIATAAARASAAEGGKASIATIERVPAPAKDKAAARIGGAWSDSDSPAGKLTTEVRSPTLVEALKACLELLDSCDVLLAVAAKVLDVRTAQTSLGRMRSLKRTVAAYAASVGAETPSKSARTRRGRKASVSLKATGEKRR